MQDYLNMVIILTAQINLFKKNKSLQRSAQQFGNFIYKVILSKIAKILKEFKKKKKQFPGGMILIQRTICKFFDHSFV